MKTRRLSRWLALAASISASAVAAEYEIINPSGGTDSSNGVRFYAGATGGIQAQLLGQSQFYFPNTTPPDTDFGLFLAVGSEVFGKGYTPFVPVTQALSGGGTETSPQTVSTVMDAPGTGFRVVWSLAYVRYRNVVAVTVDVSGPPGNVEVVKLYLGGDTYATGGDSGAAYSEPVGALPADVRVLGVTRKSRFLVLVPNSPRLSHFYSANYAGATAELAGGADYSDAFDANEDTDNGLGAQWTLGALAAPVRVTFTLGFSAMPGACGNGALDGFETCDDGNLGAADGCDGTCQTEPGMVCLGVPSRCHPLVCGDGAVEGSEACDDGNLSAGDGCAGNCSVEGGYDCAGSPSRCGPRCGDGIVLATETCDDGNAVPGDGCSAACATEGGYLCPLPGASCEDIDECALAPSVCEANAVCSNRPGGYSCDCASGTVRVGDHCLTDRDGDGEPDVTDCAPDDGTRFPGAVELCDGVDGDCDGRVADEFPDLDGDDQPDCADPDDDGDGAPDGEDSAPFDPHVCHDLDADTCDECSAGSVVPVTEDGADYDADGLCDPGDPNAHVTGDGCGCRIAADRGVTAGAALSGLLLALLAAARRRGSRRAGSQRSRRDQRVHGGE